MNSELEKDLKNLTSAEIYFDSAHRKVYSVDASIYEIEPLGIIIPKTKKDIIEAIKIAAHYQVPIIARGAATGIAGGCIGRGLIIDYSCYLNHIETINFHNKFATCQPGVVQDTLNKMLSVRNYRLGPDTSTGDRATLGGMTANNSAGARSLYYGKMVDHVIGIEMVLANGEVLYFTELNENDLKQKLSLNTTEGHIYREVCRIRDQYRDAIIKNFPSIPRRVSGYNLDELLKPGPFNLCKLITGSEGTLGCMTQIKVNIQEKPLHQGLCVIFFQDMQEAMQAIAPMMEFNPLSLELIDHHIIDRGRESPSMRGKLQWLIGNPQVFIVAELQGKSSEEVQEKLSQFAAKMKSMKIGYDSFIITNVQQMNHVWELRKAGLGLLLSKRSYNRAIAFIEDLSIPPHELPTFMKKFQNYLKSVGKEAGIYGHVGSGCIHVRPYIDLRSPDELHLMKKMIEDVSNLVLDHHGALSGEHGDGIVRTWLNKKMFGHEVYQAFKELKAAFDPHHLMNPGKIVDGPEFLKDLRLNPEKPIQKIDTFLDFSPEGGLELAADLCNGNGLCRKSEGTMCPSFQATEHEYDSTRARAQVLRSIIHSNTTKKDLSEKELMDVLDLCLQCKGCKTECPSQVDMAKMKVEALYQYQKKYGISLRNRLFGKMSQFFSYASILPRFTNALLSNPLIKSLLNYIGITSKRSLPKLALKRFSKIIKKPTQFQPTKGQVVLFNDTYTEFLLPEIGQSALKVLQALGYNVIVPTWTCCGRPLISKGMLPEARDQAEKLVNLLLPYAEKNIPIIGLEPSCLLTIKDDFKSLLPNLNFDLLISNCFTFDEFIAKHISNSQLPFSFNQTPDVIKYHIHCYQKSSKNQDFTSQVLKCIPNCEFEEIKSGCCGMAGSFGYEKEHYDISMKIANIVLFLSIKHTQPNTTIIANGFSCRTQILQGTDHPAVHLAEFLANKLNAP